MGLLFCLMISVVVLWFLAIRYDELIWAALWSVVVMFSISCLSVIGIVKHTEMSKVNTIYEYKQEAAQVSQVYKESRESNDKHIRISAIAGVAVYNTKVKQYKKLSENLWVGFLYPKEVADELQYIELEKEEEDGIR